MLAIITEPNLTQLIAVGGVSLLILIYLGKFFKENIWPMIQERMRHQVKMDDSNRQALLKHIETSHTFMSQQLSKAQEERTNEIRMFLGEVAKSNENSREQRREFLEELARRDKINEEQTRLLRAIATHLKLEDSPRP